MDINFIINELLSRGLDLEKANEVIELCDKGGIDYFDFIKAMDGHLLLKILPKD